MADLEEQCCASEASNEEQQCSSSSTTAAAEPTPNSERQNHHDKQQHDVKRYHRLCSTFIRNNLRSLAVVLICGITVISLGVTFLLSSSSSNEQSAQQSAQQVVPRVKSSKASAIRARNVDGLRAGTTTNNNNNNNNNNRDLFLLSGQSNMEGHTTSRQSITSNSDYFNTIKSILEQGDNGNLTTMQEQLYNIIYEANYKKNNTSNDQVATTLTNGVMNLYKSGLLNDLDTPLQFGKCSFQEASDSKVYDVSQGTVPISSASNCGHSFGHELLFARTMELGAMNFNTTREFEMHKVARGGSGLFEDWYPNHGLHWNLLQSAIEEQKGDWKGFIWHQGSQAAWSVKEYGEDRSLTYYGNLTGLVSEVRELMFQNSVTWRCKEEIPVVIVQVGSWPGRDAAKRTRDAQARFCNQDPRAVLVKTDDLSRFYHYDAASFLISGNRIAYAYQEALGGVVECPDGVPSSSPPNIESSFVPTTHFVSSYMPTANKN